MTCGILYIIENDNPVVWVRFASAVYEDQAECNVLSED